MESAALKPAPKTASTVVGLVMVFLLFPLGVAFLAGWLLASIAVHLALLVMWLPRGRRVLFVTSDDPRWKPYLDRYVVPRLPKSAVVLDWSQRARWSPFGLGVWLYRLWSGGRDFNPIAIVVRAWPTPRIFRFWSPFEELSLGHPEPLRAVETALFAEIGR